MTLTGKSHHPSRPDPFARIPLSHERPNAGHPASPCGPTVWTLLSRSLARAGASPDDILARSRSNAKGTGSSDGWAKHKPMDCEEMLVTQVQISAAASPGTRFFIYRNAIKALPCVAATPPNQKKKAAILSRRRGPPFPPHAARFASRLPTAGIRLVSSQTRGAAIPPRAVAARALTLLASRTRAVRVKAEDPAYAPWFLPFNCSASNPTAGCHVPVCDNNYSPPLCT